MLLSGLDIIALVSLLSYSLTDVVKLALNKVPGFNKISNVLLPTLTVACSIYIALLLHANLFTQLNVNVYGAVVQAYVITGLLASLGSKAVHDRFGHLIARKPRIEEIKELGVGTIKERVLGKKEQ